MLYVIPTPIGNLQDITLRALDIIKAVPLIIAENPAHTRTLLRHFNIPHKIVLQFAEYNEQEVLENYLTHRQVVVRRRTEFELRKAKERAHILEGLKIALDHIDEVIKTIRASATREEAFHNLIKKFKLSEIQTQAILDMRLQTLAGLERKK